MKRYITNYLTDDGQYVQVYPTGDPRTVSVETADGGYIDETRTPVMHNNSVVMVPSALVRSTEGDIYTGA